MSDELSHIASPASIEQLNLGYIKDEDRLLLKVGLSDGTEVAIWLTRRLVKSLWSLMRDANMTSFAAHNHADAFGDVVSDISEEGDASHLDFTQTYAKRSARTETPFLPASCEMVFQENKQSRLDFLDGHGKVMHISLNDELSLALVNMIQLSVKEADWALVLRDAHHIFAETTQTHVLH